MLVISPTTWLWRRIRKKHILASISRPCFMYDFLLNSLVIAQFLSPQAKPLDNSNIIRGQGSAQLDYLPVIISLEKMVTKSLRFGMVASCYSLTMFAHYSLLRTRYFVFSSLQRVIPFPILQTNKTPPSLCTTVPVTFLSFINHK